MAVHGQLYPFDSVVEDWSTFLERAEMYFAANGIADDDKRGILISSYGPKTFTLIKTIVVLHKPADIPWRSRDAHRKSLQP